MDNRQEAVKAFIEMVVSNEELAEKMRGAIEAKDSEAIAALAQEKGFELDATDFEFPTAEELAGKALDETELGNVAGGLGGTFDFVGDCSWYAGAACGLAIGGFLWMGDTEYAPRP